MDDTTRLTCSVEELAEMLGCSTGCAESFVAGDCPPPGLYVMEPHKRKRTYRVIVAQIGGWAAEVGRRQREATG